MKQVFAALRTLNKDGLQETLLMVENNYGLD